MGELAASAAEGLAEAKRTGVRIRVALDDGRSADGRITRINRTGPDDLIAYMGDWEIPSGAVLSIRDLSTA